MSTVRESGRAAIPAPSPTSWGEIEPSLLEDVRAPVPAFPLDVLPPFWRNWVGATARSAGAPNDYVALSVLAAVAGIAGTAAQVRLAPRWIEPLGLRQAIVGPPSTAGRASAGQSRARRPLPLHLAARAVPCANREPRAVRQRGGARLLEATRRQAVGRPPRACRR